MTPLQLEILVHYYAHAVDYRDGDFSAPAVREAVDQFRNDGWLKANTDQTWDMAYTRTPKLAAFIEHVCELPEPILTWVMP